MIYCESEWLKSGVARVRIILKDDQKGARRPSSWTQLYSHSNCAASLLLSQSVVTDRLGDTGAEN